jgi:hypothetical protein
VNIKVDTLERRAGQAAGTRAPRRPAPAGPAAAARARTRVPARPRPAIRAIPRRAAPLPGSASPAAQATSVPRTPFILLLLGLLGGGLICLLVINTTLAAASFRISDLQKGNVQLSQQEQDLQQQVATEEAPSTIERRAYELGMRPQSVLNFVDLQTGRRSTSPAGNTGLAGVPGYGP